MRVLILGGRAPVALDHARRFAEHGWTVCVGDSVPARLSAWSGSVAKAISLPPPRGDTLAAFAAALSSAIEREMIDLLVPTCEEIFFVSRIRSRLPRTCNVFAAPFELLRELHSKWMFLAHAQDCGIEIADSALVRDIAAARKWAQGRAVVLKPEFSRFGVHVRLYPQGIPDVAPPLAPLGAWVVQSYQRGTELCSYGIAVKGQLCAHVAYRPSYRLARSSSYYFDPVSAPRIEAWVERLVARLGFTGQISFDWIDSGDGTVTVLECNPRAISGLHLFENSDPLPEAIAGTAFARIVPQQPVPRMLATVMLTAGLPAALRHATVKQWYRDWSRARDVLSLPGDRCPGLGAIADMTTFAGIALSSRCGLVAASTRDIEWDGEPLAEL